MNSRNPTADLLKGVAVVLMIQVHLFEQFAALGLSHSTIGKISLFLGGPPAAPVFLAVMGFFLARSRKTALQHIHRGLLLILGGLMLNLGLNANLLYSIHHGRFQLDPLPFIFGADILPLAGLSIIVVGMLRRLLKDNALAYFSAASVVAIVAPMLAKFETDPLAMYVVPFFWGDQWWSYFPLFPWLAYALLGVALGTAPTIFIAFESISVWKKLPAFLVLIGALLATLPYATQSITELSSYYHHGILLFLWVLGFLTLWVFVLSNLESSFGNSAVFHFIKWLGRHVTSAYVFQWLIIGNLATELYRTQSLVQVLIWFVTILCATSLLVAAFKKLRGKISHPQIQSPTN